MNIHNKPEPESIIALAIAAGAKTDWSAALRCDPELQDTDVVFEREQLLEFARASIAAHEALQAGQERTYISPVRTVPDGYKLVPIEPTEEMIQAGCLSQQATPEYDNYDDWFNSHSGGIVERISNYLRKDFRAMLAAAPDAIAQAVHADPLQAEMAALCPACGGTGTVEEQILQVKVFTDSGPAWKATTLEDWENHLACNRRVIAKDASHEQAIVQAVQPTTP